MGIIANKIRQAIYGGDVRDSIADGIEELEQLREDYDNQVINSGNSNSEIVDARGQSLKLKDRLNMSDIALNSLDTKVGNLGSNRKFMGSCTNTELIAKTGMLTDDYWYITDLTTNKCYNGTSWVDIGNNLKIGSKTIDSDKISGEIFDSIVNREALSLTPASFEYDNLTLAYADGVLSASTLARAFHSIFLPAEVVEFSFNRMLSEVWIVLGGTSARYTAIKLATTGLLNISEIINSGTLATDYISIASGQYSGAIEYVDVIKVTYKQGTYKFYKNDVLIYTLNVADVTNVNATGFKLNNRLGFIGQKDKTTDTGIAKILSTYWNKPVSEKVILLDQEVESLKSAQAIVESQWKGKIWNVAVDSITYGFGTAKTYHQYIQEDLGIATVNNYGVNSTEISTGGTSGHPFMGVYLNMDVTANLITIFGGANDFLHNCDMGTFASRDNATFYGALHNLCAGLYINYPNSKLAFFTPLRTNGTYGDDSVANTKGFILVDYVNAIKEVCDYYSIPVLDLHSMSGLSPYVPATKTKYMPDGLHPNADGHRIIADKIRAFINGL